MPPKVDVWSAEAETLLVEAVGCRPILWDSTLADYRGTDIKERLWEEITTLLGPPFTVDQVKKRFANIKGTFADNDRRIKESKRSGSGAENIFKPKWYLFEKLLFLRKACMSATSSSNISITPSGPSNQTQFPSILSLESPNSSSVSLPLLYDETSHAFHLIPETLSTVNQSMTSEESFPSYSPIGSPTFTPLQSLTAPACRPASAPPSSVNTYPDTRKRSGDTDLFTKRGTAKHKVSTSHLEAAVSAIKEIAAQPIVISETPNHNDVKEDDVDLFLKYMGSKLRAIEPNARKEIEEEFLRIIFSKT